MALIDQLGYGDTPFGSFTKSNRNFLLGLGAGMLSGGNYANTALQGKMMDDEAARKSAEERKNAEYVHQTQQILREKYPDLAKAVSSGYDPNAAYNEMFRREAASSGSAKPNIINAGDGNLYNADTGDWLSAPGGEATLPNIKGESDLRKEYGGINTVKAFGEQAQAYQRVLDSARDPSAAGDLALIFNYMKVLDPGSTVREGEFATAQNSGSIPQQIWARYNQIMDGERLTPAIREDFVRRAGELYKGAASLQSQTNERYSGLAEDYGLEPSRIVTPPPQIGVLDPNFDITEYVGDNGEQKKPLPVTNDDDYNALPSGAIFVGPDGKTRKKP